MQAASPKSTLKKRIQIKSFTKLLTDLNVGRSKICRNIGIFLKNDNAVGKNALNKCQKPYASTANPTNVQPHTTKATPPRKKPVPLKFLGLIKKRNAD